MPSLWSLQEVNPYLVFWPCRHLENCLQAQSGPLDDNGVTVLSSPSFPSFPQTLDWRPRKEAPDDRIYALKKYTDMEETGKSKEVIMKECGKRHSGKIHLILTWQPMYALSPDCWTWGVPSGLADTPGNPEGWAGGHVPGQEWTSGHYRWKFFSGSFFHSAVFSRITPPEPFKSMGEWYPFSPVNPRVLDYPSFIFRNPAQSLVNSPLLRLLSFF